MLTKKLDTGTILFVEVPIDANTFNIQTNPVEGGNHICFLRGVPDYACSYTSNLPFGNWEILFPSTEPDEDKLREVMPRLNDMEFNGIAYEDFTSTSICDTALEAYQSLKVALGVVDKNPIVLERPAFGDADSYLMSDWEMEEWQEKWDSKQSLVKKYIVLFERKT